MPIAIRAAPAALATLIGVVGLVLQTNPVRPYSDGAWAPNDLVGLLIIGLVVGLLNRSVSGLVGTIIGAAAAIAIQLYVLTESASYTPTVVASLAEPAWSREVLGGLAIGMASLLAGYAVGAIARRVPASLRSGVVAMRSSATFNRHGVIAGLTLAAAAVLAFALVRAAATSAYVPAESQPTLRVSIVGDQIASVAPDPVPAGRVVIDMQRNAGTQERWISVEGPLTAEMDAVLEAGNDPLAGGLSRLFPVSVEPVQWIARTDLQPGRYAFVVSTGFPEVGPEVTELPPVPAIDIRRFEVSGPEPTSTRAPTGGPLVDLGRLFGVGVVGWGIAGLWLTRRGRNVALAATAGVVAAGLMWVLVNLAVGQSHSPF